MSFIVKKIKKEDIYSDYERMSALHYFGAWFGFGLQIAN